MAEVEQIDNKLKIATTTLGFVRKEEYEVGQDYENTPPRGELTKVCDERSHLIGVANSTAIQVRS